MSKYPLMLSFYWIFVWNPNKFVPLTLFYDVYVTVTSSSYDLNT